MHQFDLDNAFVAKSPYHLVLIWLKLILFVGEKEQ